MGLASLVPQADMNDPRGPQRSHAWGSRPGAAEPLLGAASGRASIFRLVDFGIYDFGSMTVPAEQLLLCYVTQHRGRQDLELGCALRR